MARGNFNAIIRLALASERASRQRDREKNREKNRLDKENERLARLKERLGKQDYCEARIAEAEKANTQLAERLDELSGILFDTFNRDPSINFEEFLRHPKESDLDSDQTLQPIPEPKIESFWPEKPKFLVQLLPGAGARYKDAISVAKQRFSEKLAEFNELERRRCDALANLYASAAEHNRSVNAAETALTNNDPEAIKNYFELVLTRSEYPSDFPLKVRGGYVPESKLIAFDYQLPTIEDVIPRTEKYRYVKSTDEITELKKSERARQTLYANVIAQTALRCLYELFAADKLKQINVAALNGYVDTVDPSTGRAVQPCIISVRATRDEFCELNLKKVDPNACLRRLSASISRSPSELVAVKPVIDVNMVDPRFIEEQDILSTLDNRLNLMELTPGEFESLITNLFQKMGLDTKLTQASRDGGVDCVAFDARPFWAGRSLFKQSAIRTRWE